MGRDSAVYFKPYDNIGEGILRQHTAGLQQKSMYYKKKEKRYVSICNQQKRTTTYADISFR